MVTPERRLVEQQMKVVLLLVAAWRSSNIVECINKITQRRAQLVLGRVTVFGG